MKKLIIICITIVVCFCAHAQNTLFVRVYGQDRHIIAKGRIGYGTDSTIEIYGRQHGKIPLTIPVQQVWAIKTGRTFGHNLLVGAAVGFGTVATTYTLSITSESKQNWFYPNNVGEGIAIATLFGFIGAGEGAVAGAAVWPFKKRKTFVIESDNRNWAKARGAMFK